VQTRLYSPKLELLALRYALKPSTDKDEKNARLKVLGKLREDMFGYDPARVAFLRLSAILQNSSSPVSYDQLCEDPILEEKVRDILLKARARIKVPSDTTPETILEPLKTYRTRRKLVDLGLYIQENLEEGEDPHKIFTELASKVSRITSEGASKDSFVHLGKGDNASKYIKDILLGKKPPLVKTGFAAFDKRNGGFPFPGLVVLGANTSGGKSVLGQQLLINMSIHGNIDSCLVSLEMSTEQVLERLLSNLTKIPMSRIQQRKLSEGEKKKVANTYRKLRKEGKEGRKRFTIYVPEEDVTVEELKLILQPFSYKVILIDYISLLSGVDTEDSWRKLAAVARFSKIWSRTHNVLIVLLVQISEEGVIRYSKGILENADNAWYWVQDDKSRESGILNIKQKKARNQEPFPFSVSQDLAFMRIEDLQESAGGAPAHRRGAPIADTDYLDDMSDGTNGVEEVDDTEEFFDE